MYLRVTLFVLLLMTMTAACTNDNSLSKEIKRLAPEIELTLLANNLQVTYQHMTNVVGQHCDKTLGDGACFQARISLTSPLDIGGDDWVIYFSHIAPVQSFTSDSLVMRVGALTRYYGRIYSCSKFPGYVEVNYGFFNS